MTFPPISHFIIPLNLFRPFTYNNDTPLTVFVALVYMRKHSHLKDIVRDLDLAMCFPIFEW